MPDGAERHFIVNGVRWLRDSMRPDMTLLVFHDVTPLKNAEATRRDFVANVSHELRTPLSLISGFVETLLDGALQDTANATRFLRTIKRHTDRLTFLIDDLLQLSQLESGRIQLQRQPVTLRELAQAQVEDFGARAAARSMASSGWARVLIGIEARCCASSSKGSRPTSGRGGCCASQSWQKCSSAAMAKGISAAINMPWPCVSTLPICPSKS